MFKKDAVEAAGIMQRALRTLLLAAPTKGEPGADLRTACGDLILYAQRMLQNDEAGPPLANCFDLALDCGMTQAQLSFLRSVVDQETPKTVGATMVKQAIIALSLATEGRIILGMTFVSRNDVDALLKQMNVAFAASEELAADEMAQMTYRAIVEEHAAITAYLVETARPLPRMLAFEFGATMSTLVTAQRLYYDAGRADELRAENKVVHPAFMLPFGRALSS